MIRIYIALAIIVLLGAGAWGVKYYYDSTQEKIQTLTANNTKLEISVSAKNLVIATQTVHMIEQEARILALDANMVKAEENIDALRKILDDHDLTRLVIAKPGLIERRINNATKNLFNELRTDTSP
jgi:hypothetical protein